MYASTKSFIPFVMITLFGGASSSGAVHRPAMAMPWLRATAARIDGVCPAMPWDVTERSASHRGARIPSYAHMYKLAAGHLEKAIEATPDGAGGSQVPSYAHTIAAPDPADLEKTGLCSAAVGASCLPNYDTSGRDDLGVGPSHDVAAAAAATAAAAGTWAPIVDPASRRTYYFNVETQESTWDRPPDAARILDLKHLGSSILDPDDLVMAEDGTVLRRIGNLDDFIAAEAKRLGPDNSKLVDSTVTKTENGMEVHLEFEHVWSYRTHNRSI